MKYADKQHIAYFSWIESALFYSRSEHTPKGGASYALQRLGLRRRAYRAALYGSSSYAVGLTAPGPTAQLGHLYGSRSGTLRLGSLRCRAYLAELYSVDRRAVRDSSSSSTEYRHLALWYSPSSGADCNIRSKAIRISMLVRSRQKQDCPLYNCLNRTTYNFQNISALTANLGTNTLAFSYAELTLCLRSGCRKYLGGLD